MTYNVFSLRLQFQFFTFNYRHKCTVSSRYRWARAFQALWLVSFSVHSAFSLVRCRDTYRISVSWLRTWMFCFSQEACSCCAECTFCSVYSTVCTIFPCSFWFELILVLSFAILICFSFFVHFPLKSTLWGFCLSDSSLLSSRANPLDWINRLRLTERPIHQLMVNLLTTNPEWKH